MRNQPIYEKYEFPWMLAVPFVLMGVLLLVMLGVRVWLAL